jgi:hypothetical protein
MAKRAGRKKKGNALVTVAADGMLEKAWRKKMQEQIASVLWRGEFVEEVSDRVDHRQLVTEIAEGKFSG